MKIIILTGLFIFLLLSIHARSPDVYSDSIALNKKNYSTAVKVTEVLLPAAMITYGIISLESHAAEQLDHSTHDELLEDHSMWYNDWDNYFQFSPAVAAFTMKLCGVKSTHSLPDMFIIYALSNVLETGIIYTTKTVTPRERPSGSSYNSFPSGHTATAFVAAEFLHQEYKDKPVWISVSGYAMASMIGVSRVYNDRHWVSDVVAGAGIGILSTKVIYWTYPWMKRTFGKKDKPMNALFFPSYDNNNGQFIMNFSYTF